MAGFIEFSIMRTRGDIDQKLLSELYYQCLNVEEDFVKELFFATETRLGRVYVQERVLTNENAVHILDYERASHIIKSTSHMGISMCYCRHKMQHVGKACDAPMDICMTFGNVAASLIKHGFARRVEASEGLELLAKAYEHNLVQCGENAQRSAPSRRFRLPIWTVHPPAHSHAFANSPGSTRAFAWAAASASAAARSRASG